jgi:DNA-binding beta-propeller fold protein YncE
VAAAAGACGEPFVVLGDGPGIMRIVLGVGDSIGTRVDSIATRTRLLDAAGIAYNPANTTLYVGDRGAVRQSQGITTRVARMFSVNAAGRSTLLLDAGGCASGPCILEVTALAIASNGALIIADQVGNRVFRYAPGTAPVVIAGNGTAATALDGATANAAPINQPAGVAVGEGGRIYIAELGASRVRYIDGAGLLQTAAGTGVRGYTGDAGPATSAQLDQPNGLLFADGMLYITDGAAHVVRRIDAAGLIGTVAGAGGPGYTGDGGPATQATLNRPVALAITPDRRQLFISDHGNNRIRAVDLASGMIQTFAGTGTAAYTGNRRPAGQTSLLRPWGIDANAAGFLFVVDPGHGVVWRTSVGG